nr:carbohydrate-binding family 9-like protein [Planctomycetota bacterium]
MILLRCAIALLLFSRLVSADAATDDGTLTVARSAGAIAIDGLGDDAGWTTATWYDLQPSAGSTTGPATRARLAYDDAALYLFFDCDDQRLTTTALANGTLLFTEDVVEAFIHPDPAIPAYLEYQWSPVAHELCMLILKSDGAGMGNWLCPPDGENRRSTRATAARGGDREPGATVTGWTAEIRIPFAAFTGLANPPAVGATWRANLF